MDTQYFNTIFQYRMKRIGYNTFNVLGFILFYSFIILYYLGAVFVYVCKTVIELLYYTASFIFNLFRKKHYYRLVKCKMPKRSVF
jgi:hypothetical protein